MKSDSKFEAPKSLGSDCPWADGESQTTRKASGRQRAPEEIDESSNSPIEPPQKGGRGGQFAKILGKKKQEQSNTQEVDSELAAGGSIFSWVFSGDRVLWIICIMLSVLSILVVYSSAAKMGYDAHMQRSTADFLQQQLVLLGLCVFILIIFQKFDAIIYKKLTNIGFFISLCMTIAVYFMNVETNGAARWFPIGSFQFQPSEALKITTILFLAKQLAERQQVINTLRIVPSLCFWTWRKSAVQRNIWRTGTFPILVPVLLSCLVIFPAHTSSALLVFGVTWVMMLIGRVKVVELAKIVGLAFVAGLIVVNLNIGRSQTAEGRFSTWIHLWTESQIDKPVEHLTDTERSMIAIHNGGILGKGAGQSTMRVEMIHPESDYAYAFFIEEYGTLFAIMLLLLYLWLFYRAIVIFRQSHDSFAGLMVLGLGLQITCQALLHIMVVLNLAPETGQTLPLISRGGSSMIFTSVAFALILAVSRQNEQYALNAAQESNNK